MVKLRKRPKAILTEDESFLLAEKYEKGTQLKELLDKHFTEHEHCTDPDCGCVLLKDYFREL